MRVRPTIHGARSAKKRFAGGAQDCLGFELAWFRLATEIVEVSDDSQRKAAQPGKRGRRNRTQEPGEKEEVVMLPIDWLVLGTISATGSSRRPKNQLSLIAFESVDSVDLCHHIHHPDVAVVLSPGEIQVTAIGGDNITKGAAAAFEFGEASDLASIDRQFPQVVILSRTFSHTVVNRFTVWGEAR